MTDSTINIQLGKSKGSQRRCGDCTACCKLLPMLTTDNKRTRNAAAAMIEAGVANVREFGHMLDEFDKPAGCRCPHQRRGKGCVVYARRPFGCRMWNCRWLINDGTNALARPDRAHYVIDTLPDFVTIPANDGTRQRIMVIQIWLDPDYPEAHRDPKLRAFLAREAERKGVAALIRLDASRAFTLWAPAFTGGDWFESAPHASQEKQHAFKDIIDGAK